LEENHPAHFWQTPERKTSWSSTIRRGLNMLLWTMPSN
jgi:hypothetical protein